MSNGNFLLKFYDDVIATDHALERYNETTNIIINKTQLIENFKKAEKISFDELTMLGFSCNYAGRIKNGEKSFYYIDNKTIKNNEIVYVLSEGATGNVLIIVTVLYHNKESQYRKEVFEAKNTTTKIINNCHLLVVNEVVKSGKKKFVVYSYKNKQRKNIYYLINQINNETGMVASTFSGTWKFDDLYRLTQVVETTPMYGLIVRRKKKDDIIVIDHNLIVLEPFKRIDLICKGELNENN